MIPQWRELLDRALHGDEISAEEMQQLAAALADRGNRREALSWLEFDAAAIACLDPAAAVRCERSKQKLLAKAALRAKARSMREPKPAGRVLWRSAVAATAAAVLLAIAAALWMTRPPAEAPITASGHYRVVAIDGRPRNDRPQRGDRVIAHEGGASLILGGFANLSLDPGTEIVLSGAPGREVVQLDLGRLGSRVQPARGHYRVQTPLGSLEVKGTEFIVSVERRDNGIELHPGEDLAGKAWKEAAVVSVMVVSGVVAFRFGKEEGTLRAGESRTFGEGARTAHDIEQDRQRDRERDLQRDRERDRERDLERDRQRDLERARKKQQEGDSPLQKIDGDASGQPEKSASPHAPSGDGARAPDSGSAAGEDERTTGKVVSVEGLRVVLRVPQGLEVAFRALETDKLAAQEVEQLQPGDEVTVTWVARGHQRIVRDVEGRGTLVGAVAAKSDQWIEIQPSEGPAIKLFPRWIGGFPEQGGGFDETMVRRIAKVKIGDWVTAVWEMPEGKRIVELREGKGNP